MSQAKFNVELVRRLPTMEGYCDSRLNAEIELSCSRDGVHELLFLAAKTLFPGWVPISYSQVHNPPVI